MGGGDSHSAAGSDCSNTDGFLWIQWPGLHDGHDRVQPVQTIARLASEGARGSWTWKSEQFTPAVAGSGRRKRSDPERSDIPGREGGYCRAAEAEAVFSFQSSINVPSVFRWLAR